MMAACCPEDKFDSLDISSSDETFSSDSLLKKNMTPDDSFLSTDHSLDIDSPEDSDYMFNNDSYDI